MKVLFISYYHNPYPGVAPKRATYWAENIGSYGISSKVITATKQKEKRNNIIYIPNTGKGSLMKKFFRDPGQTWKNDLKNYFEQFSAENFDFDVVIFTGGPFMHFSLASFLKKKFNCKVVLDYRDPFAVNPRFKNESKIKRAIKSKLEERFNRCADLVTTVNEYCRQFFVDQKNVKVIPNGYDETVLSKFPSTKEIVANQLFYGGKVYDDFDMEPFFELLKENQSYYFLYIGSDCNKIPSGPKNISKSESMAYTDYMNRLASSDICLLFTGGKPFESPTKLYDYLAFNKKVLIISSGDIRTGAIQEIISDYPNVQWTKNISDSIKIALNDLGNQKIEIVNVEKYSRSTSLKKLVEELKHL